MPRRRLRDLSVAQNPPNSEQTNSEQQTAIGSSNVPNIADEPAEIQRRALLKDLYELNFVERVKVARNNWIRSLTFSRILGHYRTKCQSIAYQLRVMASYA
ncbi:hypothetical protein Gotur_024197 [Gossypium turneri]